MKIESLLGIQNERLREMNLYLDLRISEESPKEMNPSMDLTPKEANPT